MPTDTVKTINACKATWAAAIERTGLAKDEKKRLAVGLRWGRDGAEKGIELHLSVLHRWPFLRPGMLVGPVTSPPPSPPSPQSPPLVWDKFEEVDIEEVVKVEMGKEREDHLVAPGQSRKSFDGVVGGDCPYVWGRC